MSNSEIANTLHALIKEKYVDVPAIKITGKETQENPNLGDKLSKFLTATYDFENISQPLEKLYKNLGRLVFNKVIYALSAAVIITGFSAFFINHDRAINTLTTETFWPIALITWVLCYSQPLDMN